MTERPPRPRFTGVDTYIDSKGRYTYRFPSDWLRYEIDPSLEGVMFSPVRSDDPKTWFSSFARLLEIAAVAEDAPLLRGAVNDGIRQLPGAQIEHEYEAAYGNLLKFERVFTFSEGQDVRKRKLWILYVEKWQIVLTYQGESPGEWEYWLPMGNYCLNSFNVPPELWYATDRDLNKPGTPFDADRVRRGRGGAA
jgi:hypothetical protein